MEDHKGNVITHVHADHIVDRGPLMLFAPFEIKQAGTGAIPIFGPGERGRATPLSARATSTPELTNPTNPGAGIEATFAGLVHAYAAHIHDRRMDFLTLRPYECVKRQNTQRQSS